MADTKNNGLSQEAKTAVGPCVIVKADVASPPDFVKRSALQHMRSMTEENKSDGRRK